jgi:hypothetical protein
MADAEWYPKREARRPFEPPPWEREQFESLRREREASEPQALEPEAAEAAAVEEPAAEPVAEKRTDATAKAEERAEPGEALVTEMLFELGASEPRVDEHLRVVRAIAAGFMLFLGVSMVGWGIAATAKAQGHAVGLAAAMLVMLLGLTMVGTGAWIGLRSMKERGD